MRLIDADALEKHLNEQIRDFATEEDKDCFRFALQIVDETPTFQAIPTEWLRKELIECLYDGISSEDVNKVFFKAIARWEKENESSSSD